MGHLVMKNTQLSIFFNVNSVIIFTQQIYILLKDK